MKFNLKNRPKRKIPIVEGNAWFNVSTEVYDSDEVDEWFEGFEKELRERLEKLQNVKGRRSAVCRAHEAGEIETIKEILGE